MAKAKKLKSKRTTTRQRAKVVKKVSQFKRTSRRTVKKLRKAGLIKKRKEKDPALMIPNSWPNKEEILRDVQLQREQALEERRLRREAAKKKREWEKANPEKVRIRLAREEARVRRLEEEAKISNKLNQQFSVQLVKVLPRVNCVIQVLDARAPLASLSSAVETMIETYQQQAMTSANHTEKTIVYVLNKADLLPRSHVEAFVNLLSKKVLLDDTRLKIRRRLAVYSNKVTDSPLLLMQALQTVFLRSAQKHKIIAAVVGHSNVGKNSIMSDLEAASNIVSVHPSSAVSKDVKVRIPGAREVALISLPPDSDIIAQVPKGFDCVFKQLDLIEVGGVLADAALLQRLASVLVEQDAVRVATHFKITKPANGAELLSSVATKRGLVDKSKNGEADLLAAGRAVCSDVVSGKLLVASSVPTAVEVTHGSVPSPTEPLDAVFAPLLRYCKGSKAKMIEVDPQLFATVDHRILVEIDAADTDDEESAEQKADDAYELKDDDWSGDEELEELEEVEEEEEGDVDMQ